MYSFPEQKIQSNSIEIYITLTGHILKEIHMSLLKLLTMETMVMTLLTKYWWKIIISEHLQLTK